MADTKISAATDIVTLTATDMVPVARSGSSTAYHATMAEVGVFATSSLPVATTTVLGVVKVDGATITVAGGTISTAATASTAPPAMDGAANAGVAGAWSRGDHIHPVDVSRAPLASPTFTGTVTIPSGAAIAGYAPLASPTFTGTPTLPTGTIGVTQTTGNSTTALATTAFVQAQMVASGAGVSTWNTRAGAVVLQQSDLSALNVYDDAGRNRIHNCGFSINQRGYASGAALAAGAYGHDRWKAGAGGCTYTFTQNQPLTTITITAGSLQQVVEAMSVAAGTYTLSWTGSAQGRVNAGTYATSPVTVAGLPANTAITIEFNTGTLGSVQLEIGSVATPLDYGGSPQQQLASCQRFFTVLSGLLVGSYGNSGAATYNGYALPVAMRSTPTAAFSGTSYGNASTLTLNSASPTTVSLGITVTTTGPCWAQSNVALSADL